MLRLFKDLAGAPGPAIVLRVGEPPVAFLRPVAGRPERLDPADVERLTAWRNRHVRSVLTEFEATTERTAAWLVANHPDDSRILFMVDDPEGATFGYMGLAFIDWRAGIGEADSIVRGADSAPGTMSAALRALIEWATGPLGLHRIVIRVRSDNPVMPFYDRLGFVERRRVPLRLDTAETEGRRWVEDPTADSGLFVIHLEAGGTTA